MKNIIKFLSISIIIIFLQSCTRKVEKKDIKTDIAKKEIKKDQKKDIKDSIKEENYRYVTSEFQKLAISCKDGQKAVCRLLKKKVEKKIKSENIKFNISPKKMKNPIEIWELGFLLRYRYISESISIDYFNRACNLNEKKACRELGLIYYYADFGDRNLNRAKSYFDKGCSLKDGNSCSYLGRLSFYSGMSFSTIREQFKQGCSYGDGIGCNNLENIFKITGEINKNSYYKRSCKLGNSLGCYNYLELIYRGDILYNKDEVSKALNILDKNCKNNDTSSCTKLGTLYTDYRKIISYDDKKAEKYFKKSCYLDDMEGCNNLAYYIYEKRDHDYINSYNNLYKACIMGFSASCIHIGFYHIDGVSGIEKNSYYGFSFHKKACKLDKKLCFKLGSYHYQKNKNYAEYLYKDGCRQKDGKSCYFLASFYEEHSKEKESKKYYNSSIKLLKESCKKNDLFSCSTLGYAYRYGRGVKKNIKKAKNFYQKACKLGDKNSCYIISRL